MKNSEFKFSEKQRKELLRCWKRKGDQDKAGKFLDQIEARLSRWLSEAKSRAGVGKKIEVLSRLGIAGNTLPHLLDNLPPDVAEYLNAACEVRGAHGDWNLDWLFDPPSEIPLPDGARVFVEAFLRGISGNESPRENNEPSQGGETLARWDHQHLAETAQGVANVLRGARWWIEKDLEKTLLLFAAICYDRNFGKPPSSANGSSFRKFSAELSKITGYDFGAECVAYACDIYLRHCKGGT